MEEVLHLGPGQPPGHCSISFSQESLIADKLIMHLLLQLIPERQRRHSSQKVFKFGRSQAKTAGFAAELLWRSRNEGRVLSPLFFSPRKTPCAGENTPGKILWDPPAKMLRNCRNSTQTELTFSPLVPFNPRTPSAPLGEKPRCYKV